MMIAQGMLSPFSTKKQNRVELANEVFTLLCTYVLFTFTDFVPRPETRYKSGWSMIGMIAILLCFNLFIMSKENMSCNVKKVRLILKKRSNKKLFEQRKQEYLIAQQTKEQLRV